MSASLRTSPSRSRSKSPRSKSHPQLSPEDYGLAILKFSKTCTGEGEIHEGLAEFLNSEPLLVNLNPEGTALAAPSDKTNAQSFLTVYEIEPDCPKSIETHTPQFKAHDFASPTDFYNASSFGLNQQGSAVLFLRGYPSPSFLKVIGSKYSLEPDFFAQHLDFFNPSVSEALPTVGLPTSQGQVFQLYITTIGSRNREERQRKQHEVDAMRKADEAAMDIYSDNLAKRNFGTGNAIVRHYSTLDERHFAIEQKVSIHIRETDKGWVGKFWTSMSYEEKLKFAAFVWLDSGNRLDDSVKGPWSYKSDETRFHPISNYSPLDALNPGIHDNAALRRQSKLDWPKLPQTAALLTYIFGSKLQQKKQSRDIMYALHEIFSLSAQSELKFLVQVDSRLRKTLKQVDEDVFDGFTELTFIRRLLHRHMQQINLTVTSLKTSHSQDRLTCGGLARDRRPSDSKAEHSMTTRSILKDFTSNLEYAMALDKQCQEGIAILMSSASIAESKKAMAQQERVAKLTLLAFIFAPLSFTTSIFGMNLKEMDEKVMSLWIWILVSFFVVGLALIAFFCTKQQLVAPFRWMAMYLGRMKTARQSKGMPSMSNAA